MAFSGSGKACLLFREGHYERSWRRLACSSPSGRPTSTQAFSSSAPALPPPLYTLPNAELTDQVQRYARSDDIAELKRSIAELKSDLEEQQDLNQHLVLFQDRLMSKNDALASEVRELRAALPSRQRDDDGAAAASQGAPAAKRVRASVVHE